MKVSAQITIVASKGNQVLGMIMRNIICKERRFIVALYKVIVIGESGVSWPPRVIWSLLKYQSYGAAIFLTSIGTSTYAHVQAVTLWRQWM